ncbi:MAG: hypothetical protein AAGJ87_03260 [Pseudomonadota bacterium]
MKAKVQTQTPTSAPEIDFGAVGASCDPVVFPSLFCAGSNAERLTRDFLSGLARRICRDTDIQIENIIDEAGYAELRDFRLTQYHRRRGYLPALVRPDGGDDLDRSSYLFLARCDGAPVATVRFCFDSLEVEKYYDGAQLEAFLGPDFRNTTVEVSRLVADPKTAPKGIVEAIVTYGGLAIFFLTQFHSYTAYARSGVRQGAFGFSFDDEREIFSIQSRGDHSYELLRGAFMRDLIRIMTDYRDVAPFRPVLV